MNETQKSLLGIIADNPALSEALKDLMIKHFEDDGARTDAITDEQLGRIYRARLVGLQKVSDIFLEITKCKTWKETSRGPVNSAR